MGDRGVTILDFGSGRSDASVDVAVPNIIAGLTADVTTVTADTTAYTADQLGSLVEAWLYARGNAEHSADEHELVELKIIAGNIVQGARFTVYGVHMGRGDAVLAGKWTVEWIWA